MTRPLGIIGIIDGPTGERDSGGTDEYLTLPSISLLQLLFLKAVGYETHTHNTNSHLNTVLYFRNLYMPLIFSLKSEVVGCLCLYAECCLTTSVTVLVVGIEASLQHLRHFVHLIMLDEVHELPQIGLRNQRRGRAITVRRNNKWLWV